MNEEKFRRMSITHMLDKSVYLHKRNLGTSALYLFVMSILITVIGVILLFIVLLPTALFMSTTSMMLGNNIFETGYLVSISMLLLIIVSLFYSINSIEQSGIIIIGSNGFLGRKVDVSDAITGAFKNILKVLSVMLAGMLLLIPVFLFCGVILFQVLSNLTPGTFGFYAGIIVTSIIFIVVLSYFMVVHAFSLQIAIIEKIYFFKALKKSRILVKGRFWRTFGCFISASLSVSLINLSIISVFALIGGIIFAILGSSGINDDTLVLLTMLGNIARTPLQVLVSLFVSPISGIFMTILYYNMRFEKEGYDIELNILRLKNS